ncbi:MAG: DUF1003 domain-containing protein [Fimbriimonadaceae bacterium]
MPKTSPVTCPLCRDNSVEIPLNAIRPEIADSIRAKNPTLRANQKICEACYDIARVEYIRQVLSSDRTQLDEIEFALVEKIGKRALVSENALEAHDEKLSIGDRLADRIAQFGGSWAFIITFMVIIFAWMVTNTLLLAKKPFDPYPFILLNLVLSTLAALQAPVIMMSQNRQNEKDRLQAESDYRINLKAELELQFLHEKLDHLLNNQMQSLLELQDVQIDLLKDRKSSNLQED